LLREVNSFSGCLQHTPKMSQGPTLFSCGVMGNGDGGAPIPPLISGSHHAHATLIPRGGCPALLPLLSELLISFPFPLIYLLIFRVTHAVEFIRILGLRLCLSI
uniref:Uncharacterized protein n=1 Tax=Otus sunia TaxID=257818 RepID=A0A8C8E5X1_9STRI